jgi:hypothetical protein
MLFRQPAAPIYLPGNEREGDDLNGLNGSGHDSIRPSFLFATVMSMIFDPQEGAIFFLTYQRI